MYNIGEAPGKEEDARNEQFSPKGESGKLLRKHANRILGDDFVDEKVRWNNCVRCRPPKNRTPSIYEVASCRQSIEQDIMATKPKIIVGYGGVPLRAFKEAEGITYWRGRLTPVKVGDFVTWYYPMLHTAFLLRKAQDDEDEYESKKWEELFEMDMRWLKSHVDNLPKPEVVDRDYQKGIEFVTGESRSDIKLIREKLKKLAKRPDRATDLETINLRPYYKDSRVVTCAIGTEDEVFAFPIQHPKAVWANDPREVVEIMMEFYLSNGLNIAHNAKFEQEWLLWLFSTFFNKGNFYGDILFDTKWGDTQAQAFNINERTSKESSMLSLDTLCNLHFDLKLKSLTNVNPAHILDYPIEEVLIYNGLDSKYDHKLYHKQEKLLNKELKEAAVRQVRTGKTLVVAQSKGMPVDRKALSGFEKEFKGKIDVVSKQIFARPEIKIFTRRFGAFNPESPDHLQTMFRDVLELPEIKQTKKAKQYSTDNEVLTTFADQGVPMAQHIMEFREYVKLYGTYIKGLPDLLGTDGLLHTLFNHLLVRTGRLSSQDPNLQNFPKRKNKHIRNILIAPEEYWIVSFDYSQIEARCIAMASGDEWLCRKLWEDYDIHMDWAVRLARKYPKAAGVEDFDELDQKGLKVFRSKVKNGLVFPWFYGASHSSVATTLHVPENIMKRFHEEFWDVLPGVKDWQKETLRGYSKYGYVEMLTGRRRHGPLTLNEAINTPIQGTAAEIVCDAGNRIGDMAWDRRLLELFFNINVHDDLTFLLPDEGLYDHIETIVQIMCEVPFEFVNVPIGVEVSVGKTWGNLEEIGSWDSRQYAEAA